MQNNTTLEDLLPRWSQIAPGECSVDGRSNTASLHLNGETYLGVKLHQADVIYAPEIEYHVRRCIEARGWIYRLALQRDGETGQMLNYATVALDEFDVSRHGHHAQNVKAAAAILSAYLQALETLTHAG